jgi:stearoyl-CoA desaturase (delta-9 desaturase)
LEVDLTFTFVRALQIVGLAWSVVPVKVASYRQIGTGADDRDPAAE